MSIIQPPLTAAHTVAPNDGSVLIEVDATVVESSSSADPKSAVTVTWSASSGTVNPATSDSNALGVAGTYYSNDSGTTPTVIITAITEDDTTGQSYLMRVANPLAAPTVTGATESDYYIISETDIETGVTVIVRDYGAKVGDTVNVYWGPHIIKTVLIEDISTDLPFPADVTDQFLTDGFYQTYYSVIDGAGNEAISSGLPVKIIGGGSGGTLPAPTVPEADPYININDLTDNAVAVHIAYPNMAVADEIGFVWLARDSSGTALTWASAEYTYSVTDTDVAQGYAVITLTADKFIDLNTSVGYEGTASCTYAVISPSTLSIQSSVTGTFRVDTVAP